VAQQHTQHTTSRLVHLCMCDDWRPAQR
jgi:hypothetical protein